MEKIFLPYSNFKLNEEHQNLKLCLPPCLDFLTVLHPPRSEKTVGMILWRRREARAHIKQIFRRESVQKLQLIRLNNNNGKKREVP